MVRSALLDRAAQGGAQHLVRDGLGLCGEDVEHAAPDNLVARQTRGAQVGGIGQIIVRSRSRRT